MKKKCLLLLAICFLAAGCPKPKDEGNANAAANKSLVVNRAEKENAAAGRGELQAEIEKIAAEAQGEVGVSVVLPETGATYSLNAGKQFPMQSVYKFPIGMAVLRHVDDGKLKLDQKVRVEKSDFVSDKQHSPIRDKNPNGTELTVSELLRLMVSESDGTACDVLLKLIGGPKAVMEYLNSLGISGINVVNTEKEIGQSDAVQFQNSASPEAMAALLRAFHEKRGLSAPSHALLLKLMIETPTGMKRLKGLLPPGTVVAHKTGSSRTVGGLTAATNDVGIIDLPDNRHIVIAVFVSNSKADDARREETIAKIARAAWDASVNAASSK